MKIIFMNILETFEVRSQLISEKSFGLRMMSYSLPATKECNFFSLKTLSSNENNFSEHIGDFWSEVPVNQRKKF